MNTRYLRAGILSACVAFTLVSTGCSVVRDQQTAGAYVDDSTITAQVKAKLVEDKTTSAAAIGVETFNGTVQLSGFAKSAAERARAVQIARSVKGVKAVQNNLVVRPAE